MKHTISIAATAFAVVVAGCNGRPGIDQQSANTVTVAGCVQSAEQGLGSPDADSKPDRFMLTTASFSAGAAPLAANDPAKTDAASAPAAPGALYMLYGEPDELRRHVNQQVEITGKINNDARDTSSPSSNRRPELHVDSVRAVAATCEK